VVNEDEQDGDAAQTVERWNKTVWPPIGHNPNANIARVAVNLTIEFPDQL
jgi:hypothetical protein